MDDLILQYSGIANIYLQGKEALEPIDTRAEDRISYYVASSKSDIVVTDFRDTPNQVAKDILGGKAINNFAESFSQPAIVEICSSPTSAEIKLRDGTIVDDALTLWLGVIEENNMPAHEIEWEILKRIDEQRIAFAVLVR